MPDETRIYDAYIAGRRSAALAAAVRLCLFDQLAEGPLALPELATRIGVLERPLGHLTRVLVALGLLESRGEHLELSADAGRFLVRGRPGSLVGLIDLEVENFLTPEMLIDALRRDRPSVYAGRDPWAEHAADPERARAFTRAMHDISSAPAEALAERLDLSKGGRLLDLGGGSGALSIALARAWPRLRCLVVDLPGVCELAAGYITEAGVQGQVTTVGLDFFRDPLPRPNDWVLLSQILHDWPPEVGVELLRRARASLVPGGRILIHEKLVSDDGRRPLANALVDLDMLVWTEGQQYRPSSLRELLQQAGLRWLRRLRTRGHWSLVEACAQADGAADSGAGAAG